MNVHYWPVGGTTRRVLPLTQAAISNHLLADWVPSLPASLGTAIFGWPQHLTEVVTDGSNDHLALHSLLRSTERQWKGVLSWMLGVAGCRQVLENEGYRWIAPLSAFYPRAKVVSTPHWHLAFSNGVLSASGDPAVSARLKPDYLAIRPSKSNSATFEWAAVESKGTARSLASLGTCPTSWYNQAHNVSVFANGTRLNIHRHLVVATRSCTDGLRPSTRSIQVRAWNSADETVVEPPLIAAVEVATAHLFGLCRNLGLTENARMLGSAVWRNPPAVKQGFGEASSKEPGLATGEVPEQVVDDGQRRRTFEKRERNPVEAASELREYQIELRPDSVREKSLVGAGDILIGARIPIEVERRPVEVDLDPAIVTLIQALGRAEDPNVAIDAFVAANRALDARLQLPAEGLRRGVTADVSAGVRISLLAE